MRREFLDSGATGGFPYDLPQHLRRHPVAPNAAGLVDRAEHRTFGNSGGSAPDVNRSLDPLRYRNRPDMSRLALQVRDHPMLFPNLDGIHRQRQKFAAAEAATD